MRRKTAAPAARPPIPHPRAALRRWGSAFLAMAILTALIAIVAVVTILNPAAPSASAQPAFTYSASWNMNGEMGGPGEAPGTGRAHPESRWVADLRPELLRGVNLMAIQEAGTRPPPSTTTRSWANGAVTENYWNSGTDRVGHTNIYFADVGQQRNGLAIVTREAADEAVLLPILNHPNARPMLGVRFGVIWYFTAHAPAAGGGGDDVLETANQFMANRPGNERHRVLADFNDNPANMPVQYHRHIVRPNQPTHQGGGELDWAYYGDADQRTVRVERQGLDSDHWMLRFFLLPGCGPQPALAKAAESPIATERADCDAPMPGETYRIHSQHLDDAVITMARFRRGSPLTLDRPATGRHASLQVLQVRFSTVPGRFLLAFVTNECIERYVDGSADIRGCNPAVERQQWEFRQGRIHSPHRGPALQPSPNGLGADLRVQPSFYLWQWEPFEPTGGSGTEHDELRKRDLGDSGEEQPDEGGEAGVHESDDAVDP